MKNIKLIGLLGGFAFLFAALPANASILWNWSFDGESGTFLTDGTANGTLAAPGSYTLYDFSVTDSTTGQYLGSMSDGRYSTISVLLPVGAPPAAMSFDWNGSAVTQFDWLSDEWLIKEALDGPSHFYSFGADGNPTNAQLLNSDDTIISEGTISVSVEGPNEVAAVPEPSTWALMIIGFCGLGLMAHRQKKSLRLRPLNS